MQTEKKYVKLIDDDIYDRIIEYKAKKWKKTKQIWTGIIVTLTKKIRTVLKCKDIEANKVDNFKTGNREVRLVSWAFLWLLSFSSWDIPDLI